MRTFLFRPEQPPEALGTIEAMPPDGFVWLDFTRDEPPDWGMWAERLLNVRVDIQHIEDSLNPAHVSFFDGV
ncbi:MAG TPA: hypothetical protein VFQ88_08175, partial [Nevskiaceae bacterium]|nr:hypothetical protein [Nevskiaceae bacterium]